MKRVLFFFAAFLLVFNNLSFASDSDLFELDEVALEEDFKDLNELETYVIEHESAPLSTLRKSNPTLLTDLNLSHLSTSSPLGTAFSLDEMDWASFAWGFCCCPIGFFVVAINGAKDDNSKISYWIGLGASFLVGTTMTITNRILGFLASPI